MLTETEKQTATPSRSLLRSMTGFAQIVVQEEGFVLTLSLRSVNHRTLDLHLNLPEQLCRFEPAVRKAISTLRPRGHLQFRVTLEREAAKAPAVDEALIGKYIELFRRVGERYGLSLETAVKTLAHLPGVVSLAGSNLPPPCSSRMEAAFLNSLGETLKDWDEMRAVEAGVMEDDLRTRTLRICKFVDRLEQLREEMLPSAQKKFKERLQTWLGQAGMDAARLAQESAVLAEHTDISEEVLRLKAHFAQFLLMLDGNAEAGKKLDFLLQEIQRELNTLLAKTTGLGESGLPMTQVALEIKGEVEKLREQVQNVQ